MVEVNQVMQGGREEVVREGLAHSNLHLPNLSSFSCLCFSCRYGVKSTLLFINKLDRQGASISRCLNSIISKGLHPLPLLLQLPLTGLGSSYLKKGSKCNSTTSASSSASQLTEEQKILSLDSGLTGLIDLLDLQILEFSGLGGEIITKTPVLINPSSSLSVLQKEVLNARNSLIETLANQDDQLLEILLEKESTESYVEISGEILRKVIRRLNLNGQILPVFLGSAFRNVGIGPLLDGVREFLPSPVEKDGGIVEGKVEIGETGMVVGKGKPKKGVDETEVTSTSNAIQIHISDPSLTLLAFKVIYDKRKGPLTFIRVYSGTLKQSTISLVNTFNGKRERFNKIFLPYADSYVEVEELRAGQIGVLVGLKETSTGDTLISTSNPSSNSKSSITSRSTLKLREIDIPPPVFSMSIEPKSKSDEGPVSEALKMLVRTDPSLRIDDGSGSGNGGSGLGSAGTGQMVLSGMGELHLEISKDRLKDEFGVNARMGEVRVSYRETLGEEVGLEGVLGMGLGEKEIKKLLDQKVEEMESQAYERKEMLDKEVGGKKLKAGVKIQVRGLIHDEEQIREKIKSEQNEDDSKEIIKIGGNLVEMDLRDLDLGSGSISDSEGQDEFTSNSSSSYNLSSIKASFLSGITGSLSRGPLTSSPITGLYIKLSQPSLFGQEISPLKSLSMVSNSALRQLLKTSNPKMMEPVMNLTLKINGKDLGKVVGDLTGNQGGEIEDVRHGDEEISKDEQIDQLIYLPPEIPFSTSSNKEIGEQESKNGNTRVKAVVPLSNLVGYSTRLRAITAGTGEFEMEFKGFKRVDEERKKEILKELGRA